MKKLNNNDLVERLEYLLKDIKVKKSTFKFNPKGKYINIWIVSSYDTTYQLSLYCGNDAQAEIIYEWLSKKILKDKRY